MRPSVFSASARRIRAGRCPGSSSSTALSAACAPAASARNSRTRARLSHASTSVGSSSVARSSVRKASSMSPCCASAAPRLLAMSPSSGQPCAALRNNSIAAPPRGPRALRSARADAAVRDASGTPRLLRRAMPQPAHDRFQECIAARAARVAACVAAVLAGDRATGASATTSDPSGFRSVVCPSRGHAAPNRLRDALVYAVAVCGVLARERPRPDSPAAITAL